MPYPKNQEKVDEGEQPPIGLARFSVDNKRVMVESLHGLLVVNPCNGEQPPNVLVAAWLGCKARDFFFNLTHSEIVLDGRLPRLRELSLETDGFVRLSVLSDETQERIWKELEAAHRLEVAEQGNLEPEVPGLDVHGRRLTKVEGSDVGFDDA